MPASPDSLPETQHCGMDCPPHGILTDYPDPTVSPRRTPEPSKRARSGGSLEAPESIDSSPQTSNTSHSSRSDKSLSTPAINGKRKRRSAGDDCDDRPGPVKRTRPETLVSSSQTSNASHSPRTNRSQSTQDGKRKRRGGADDIDGGSGPGEYGNPEHHPTDTAGRTTANQERPVRVGDDEQLVGTDRLHGENPPPALVDAEEVPSPDAITNSNSHIDGLADDKDDEQPVTKEQLQNEVSRPTVTDIVEATSKDTIGRSDDLVDGSSDNKAVEAS